MKGGQIPFKLTAVRVRQLQLFAFAAELGSISEAARQLNLSQPAATEMLKSLERAFSLQLFVGSSKGIVLTEQGKRVASRAGSAIQELLLAITETSDDAPVREVLRVGFVPPAIYGNLPAAIHRFVEANPRVLLTMRELSLSESALALLEGEIDAVIAINHAAFVAEQGKASITIHPLAPDSYRVFLSSTLELPSEWTPTPQALRALSWILPQKQSFARGLLDEWFFSQGSAPPDSYLEISPPTAAIELLRIMPYAALLPEELGRTSNHPHLRKVPGEALSLPVMQMIAFRDGETPRPVLEAFVQEVLRSCR